MLLMLQSLGVYAIIDEESKFPKATDLTLIEKMTKTFMKQSSFQRVKNQNLHFIIRHFAGPVRNREVNNHTVIHFVQNKNIHYCFLA